jgi:hypothetical protein
MRFQRCVTGVSILAAVLGLLAFSSPAAPAKDMKFEALLIWAANTETSPDPSHKPVEPDVLKKLKELPLKWKYFFAVNRVDFTVAKGGAREVVLSDKCAIAVKDIDGVKNIEVSLIGKGEPVLKRTQPLPKGELLVLGGDAPDETGWLVVLKRVE